MVFLLLGLETFVQLAIHSNTYTPGALSVPVAVLVEDEPRFAYRGLMMDYSRHFYPVDFIEHTMDAMAASKLNVLHMHITDDESFPIESTSVPELTAKGSYPGYVYTHADIARLSDYATARGILLIPEFDMPAHSSAWGAGVPEMMVQGCSPEMFAHGDTMNPTVPETFAVLNKVLGEMSDLFQKPFLHLGGDEVPTSCWLGNNERRHNGEDAHNKNARNIAARSIIDRNDKEKLSYFYLFLMEYQNSESSIEVKSRPCTRIPFGARAYLQEAG